MPLDSADYDPDGFRCSARKVVLLALAVAVTPPPPVDLRAWAAEHMEFPASDPMPGPYRADRFPMWDRLFEVLSPDHPATEVTLCGSAQIGKTMVVNVFLGGTFSAAPADTLKVDPTTSARDEWKRTKFDRFRREVPEVKRVFGSDRGRDSGDSTKQVETLDGLASLKLASAGSASDLSGTTRPRVVMDDLAKFENGPHGDPEELAVSRTLAHPHAKIFRPSTPQVKGTCRITKAYNAGTQEKFQVPCPHCGHEHALEWENMEPNLREGDPSSAAFTCPDCGCLIEERHRAEIVPKGRWVAEHPERSHVSFRIWRVYFPLGRGWGEICEKWFTVKGDPVAEQTFSNDFLGIAYAHATTAPEWEEIRDRVENADIEDGFDKGTIPAGYPILIGAVDCQDDRTELFTWAFGRDGHRALVDHRVIQHKIDTPEARSALDAVMKDTWRNEHGNRIALDRLLIDSSAFTIPVAEWVKKYPHTRVLAIKGAKTDVGPVSRRMKFEQRKSGKIKRHQKQWQMLNVSILKSSLYSALTVTDPTRPNHIRFARGLGDEIYRQITAEHRIALRSASGTEQWRWVPVDSTRLNEALDGAVYADAGARFEGWRSMTEGQWDALEAERDITPPDLQPELFDQTPAPATPAAPSSAPIWKRA